VTAVVVGLRWRRDVEGVRFGILDRRNLLAENRRVGVLVDAFEEFKCSVPRYLYPDALVAVRPPRLELEVNGSAVIRREGFPQLLEPGLTLSPRLAGWFGHMGGHSCIKISESEPNVRVA